jgi:hypothetical protein
VLGKDDVLRLSNYELIAVEKAIFEVSRKQKSQTTPVDLPRENFWSAVRQLLYYLDNECSETIRKEGGHTTKSQLQTRRLNVLRTCVNDITRLRMNAFAQHAILSNLVKTQNGSSEFTGALKKIDWNRHDPAERKFYRGISDFTDKYKIEVQWDGLLKGMESIVEEIKIPTGHKSLEEFDSKLKEEEIIIQIPEIGHGWEDPEYDDEDRIREIEDFPDQVSHVSPDIISTTEENKDGPGLRRIKILKDLNDPIITEEGAEILLTAGDIESCASLIADTLIAAGLAEAAPI